TLPACLFRVLQERSSRYCEDDVDGDERGDTERHTCCNDHLVLLYPSRIRLRSACSMIGLDPSAFAAPFRFFTGETPSDSPLRNRVKITSGVLDNRSFTP